MLAFICGMFVGMIFTVAAISVVTVAGRADRREEEVHRELPGQKE